MLKRLSAVFALLLVLGGCSMVPYYSQVKAIADQGIDTAIEDRRDVNDKKTMVIKALAGEVTRGAMLRVLNPDEQCAIDTLIMGSVQPNCASMDRLATALESLNSKLVQP
jgi:PBP1b-binding outer membrane lipoprotein LpoB